VPFFRRSPKPARGQVWLCRDPRNWSRGAGGHHFVVLIAEETSKRWRVAVIESDPPNQVFAISEPRYDLYGGVRLHPGGQVDTVATSQLEQYKGNLGSIRAAKYDEALGLALLHSTE